MRSHRFCRVLALLACLAISGCRTTPPHSAVAAAEPTKPQVHAWLTSGNYVALNTAFSAIQSEYRAGTRSDESLHHAFLVLYDADAALLRGYDGWVSAYPHSYVALLARGIYHRKVGQQRRGGAFVSETSASQIQGMQAEYELAMQDLNASKALDARPLLTLSNEIDILANSDDSAQMRALLEEARRIDPANTVVRQLYLTYLAPRWGGSDEQMQGFVEEARTEGLPAQKIRNLEGTIIADEAQDAEDAGDFATAERDYRQAMALGDAGCAACLGLVLVREQKYIDAIPVLTQAIGMDPDNSELIYWRGTAYIEVRRNREGFADLLEAVKLGNEEAPLHVAFYYLGGLPNATPPNLQEALRLFRECAAKGDARCAQALTRALQYLPKGQ